MKKVKKVKVNTPKRIYSWGRIKREVTNKTASYDRTKTITDERKWVIKELYVRKTTNSRYDKKVEMRNE